MPLARPSHLPRYLVAALAAIAVFATAAQAAPVSITAFSNPFEQVATGNSSISGSNWFTTGFTTGTSTDFLSLTRVKLSLANSGTGASSSPIVQLYTGALNPTTLFAVLTGSSISSVLPVTASFVPASSPLSLSPNTNYWVMLSAQPGDQFGWYATDESPAAQNGSGFTFIAGRKSTNAGSTWNNNLLASASAVAVDVVAIPEPPTIMLAGLGVVGVVVADRSRRRLRRGRAKADGDTLLDEPLSDAEQSDDSAQA